MGVGVGGREEEIGFSLLEFEHRVKKLTFFFTILTPHNLFKRIITSESHGDCMQ